MDDPFHRRCHDRCTLVFEIRVHGDQQREHRQQYQGQYGHFDDLDGCKEDEDIFGSLHGCDQWRVVGNASTLVLPALPALQAMRQGSEISFV
jgi:hypothetical protein